MNVVIMGLTSERKSYPFIKHLIDFSFAIIGLTLLSPLLLWIAWRIRCDSPGPVLFRGTRIGRFGRQFTILKFRTMYERSESYSGSPVAFYNDPRVTPFGKFLRETKLNELPQLWNVLKGEMSLIGPRPEAPEIVAAWPDSMRAMILSVLPGITSPTSVRYRNEEILLQTDKAMETYLTDLLPDKLYLDLVYVRHRSFWLDLNILFWTLVVLFVPGMSRYQPSDRQLFRGPWGRKMKRHKLQTEDT